MPIKCIHNDCNKYSSFGYENNTIQFCKDHKLPLMINLKHKKCKFDKCMVQPSYSFKGQIAEYCFKHKSTHMINVRKQVCKFNNCTIQPSFGFNNSKKPIYCKQHSLLGMENIISKRCNYLGCKRQGSYGINIKYCAKHRPSNVTHSRNKKCKQDGCNKFPNFGMKNKKAEYCKKHMKKGMIDVKSKFCYVKGCNIRPCFGLADDKIKICCVKHKTPEMVNIINLKYKCVACDVVATFGIKRGCRTHCATHKTPEMISSYTKLCIKCNILPAKYGPLEDSYKYCINCKKREHLHYSYIKCLYCGLLYSIKYKKLYCSICEDYLGIRHKPLKYIKTSENNMCRKLEKEIGLGIHDKRIYEGSCNIKFRPDYLYVIMKNNQKYAIIIECDENQHKQYDNSCEISRMNEIVSNSENMNIYFIRWNPDNYRLNGKLIKTSMEDKYNLLIKRVKSCIEIPPDAPCIVYKQFFDCDTPNMYEQKWDIYQEAKENNFYKT